MSISSLSPRLRACIVRGLLTTALTMFIVGDPLACRAPAQPEKAVKNFVGEPQLPRRVTRGAPSQGSDSSGGSALIQEPEVRGTVAERAAARARLLLEPARQRTLEEAKSKDPVRANLAAAMLVRWEDNSQESALEAIVLIQKAIAASPRLAVAHGMLAIELEQIGFTPEARAELEIAATLSSSPEFSASNRRFARRLRDSERRADWRAAADYVSATAVPKSRRILKQYLDARERKRGRFPFNDADVAERLARAAEIYHEGLRAHPSDDDPLVTRLFSRVVQEISPRDETDPYAPRYYIAAALHRLNREAEAVAMLRSLDVDTFHAKGQRGWAAQILCERGMQMIVRNSPVEALDLFRTAFHDSVEIGDRAFAEMYGDLASEVREDLMKAALLRNDVSAALSFADESLSSSNGRSRWDHGDVQHALDPHAAIIEYSTLHDQVIAFIIRKNDVQVVTLEASAGDVVKAADAMRQADDESFAKASARLYDIIVAPFATRLDHLSTIAVIAHRDIQGIPFGALLDVRRGQFLVERFSIVHAQSARAAVTSSQTSRRARAETTLAIAATDFDHNRYANLARLPSVSNEAANIAALSRCSRVFSGSEATPDAIERQLAENAVIHYAGHIVRRGLDAWFPLARARGRDGLSATEIAHLRLGNARVVVLAACRGASSGESNVLMTKNMADAFLKAGAPVVIASSYDVDDAEAPATMQRLHMFLQDGDDAAEALRKTAVAELRRGRGVPLSIRFMAIGGTSSLVK